MVRQLRSIVLRYLQIMMKKDQVGREQKPWRPAPSAILLGLGAVWLLLLARLSYVWHAHYRATLLALSTLQEAKQIRSPVLQGHLLQMASSLLGGPSLHGHHATQRAVLGAMAVTRLHGLEKTEWFVSPPLWAIGFIVMIVAVYWMKEGRIATLEAEHASLKEQLLAIARGWASVQANPDGRQVMHNILKELVQHTAVTAAAIYRLTDNRTDCLELYVSIGRLSLIEKPIPRLFLEEERGLVGESLATNEARYSGDFGELGYLVPGTRLPRVAVFPSRYRDRNWGILLLSGDQRGWFHTYRNVLEVLAQEVAIAAASADAVEQARRHQLMEERARMQSDILANVSHELRTPLGLVKGYLETLQASGTKMTEADRREFLDVAVAETGSLELLIEQLLTMSQIENEAVSHQPRWFRVESWLTKTLSRHSAEARQRIRVVGTVSTTRRVFGDPRTLTTVLSDLIENALKYSDSVIEVHIQTGMDSWGVTVRDYGPGVPPDALDRVFERFYRAPAQAQSEIRGTGLGLSIARHIVEVHQGAIDARNASDGGFIVSLQLPLKSIHQKGGQGHGRRRISASH